MQLWGMGRAADANFLAEQGLDYVSSSPIALTDRKDSPAPRPLSIPEIQEYIELYGQAAYNAVHLAGFDGVEVHGANGYLVDQFLQDVSNHRTDDYGGSIEKRARFGLEVIDSIVKRVGARKAAIRLSPWTTIQGEFHLLPLSRDGMLINRNAFRYGNGRPHPHIFLLR